ncbi:MAG: hypothetical protein QOE98_1948 [Gaiellaceae bacterium]|nr:hypothetical protein [Gaiellaceae bacterium]
MTDTGHEPSPNGGGTAPVAGPAPITPEFSVVAVTAAEDTAAPALRFHLEVAETSGRDVFTIALTAQINIDPARRGYDAETRERLTDLFGEPERWAATTHSFLWAHATTLVPSFAGSTRFTILVPCSYDLELAAAKYFYSLPADEVPLSFHFSGSILHRGEDGQVQVVLVPWSCSAQWKMPVEIWRGMMQRFYPNGAWARLHADTVARLRRRQVERGSVSLDACIAELLDNAGEET